MVWGQLKDYEHEKGTKVKTTATVLGPRWCAVAITFAAAVMVYGNPRFLPYGLYTAYRCYTYPNLGKGKMSVVMALNLIGVVVFDSRIEPFIKRTVLGAHLFVFFIYVNYDAIEQKVYAMLGIWNRHRPYDNKIWEEKDPSVLLWKVGSLIGRSGTAVMGLFNPEYAKLFLMGFIIFRAQDTWADVCIGSEERIKGLERLPKRLESFCNKDCNTVEVPDHMDKKVQWDYESRLRNRLYVDVTINVHRFDKIFLSLPKKHQYILAKYARDLAHGFGELERRKSEPVNPELMRRHAEVALDAGFFGMCAGIQPTLLNAINPITRTSDPKSSMAYIAFSDFLWYMNILATIEEDVKEGIVLDEELRGMQAGSLDYDVINRVRMKWLVKALSCVVHSEAFLVHPELVNCWTLRLLVLQFYKVSLDVCQRIIIETEGEKSKKSGAKALLVTFVESLSPEGYIKTIKNSLNRSGSYLEVFTKKAK